VAVFELGGWDEAELAVESLVVEPVDVFEGGELDVVEATPGSSPADELGLVEPDGGLGHGVVVRVALGADRGDGAGLGETFGVADSQVLGGFNRSSQHLDMEVVGGGGSGASAGGSCIPWSDVVTGSAVDGVA
jgi:hypothetical protein